ncbi:hypothetical protein ACJIZ3_011485 [Penstemon smallii]|uniref:DUF4218 domain-containing protein n=1 Tax=Penstemon smallii TaxID=265156 RepID=A0ABD3UNJ3_9LAMI
MIYYCWILIIIINVRTFICLIQFSLIHFPFLMSELGFTYKKIHACPNDCVLFWKEFELLDDCPKCKTSRWKYQGSKKIPQKVLRYFPLKPRLQRLFVNKDIAENMRWHKEKRVHEENALRHPADSEAWIDFDSKHPLFGNDSRNVRLGLASDGFTPFSNMGTSYSIWPVILVPYNLPPWMCMKDPYFMLSMLIPGPKGPGNEIDVYLQPLVDELKELWGPGIETYDAYKEEKFVLRAALMWTISDLPALSYLSGWPTSGYNACPVCMSETACEHLPNSQKRCYMGHRRFLPINHKWRDEMKAFDGKKEHRSAPKRLSGLEILEQLSAIEHEKFGKLLKSTKKKGEGKKRKRGEIGKSVENKLKWKKHSIFFELPYWKTLKMRHNLDIMHIEKNVCDNVLGTLMSISGKTKDNKRARRDLMEKGLKPSLHLQGEREDMPSASYTLSQDEKKIFCEFLSSIKFPDGFASNISRCVKEKECIVSGLKSHDSHIILQRLLPLATRGYLNKDVYQVLLELSDFFKNLCSKTLYLDVLDKMEKQMVLTLCKLERIFPPSFFDVMIHLMTHLASEAKIAGPVQYRWMYPFERYVRNKARPEASIAEQYIDNECMTFCSMYLHNVETRFNRMERNYDVSEQLGIFSVFACKGRPFGGPKYEELSNSDWKKIHIFVLKNCQEIEHYRSEHMVQLEAESDQNVDERHDIQFPTWFKKRVEELHVEGLASEELLSLANGPDTRVKLYSGCNVNGFRFHTKDRGSNKKTQNSGVVVEGEHHKNIIDFYGVLKDIIEVDYLRGGKRVLIFRCDWWSLKKSLGIWKDRDSNITSVNVCKTWYEDQPFVLAYQVRQVYYVQDLKLGKNWRVVEKIQPRGSYDVPKRNDMEPNDLEEPYQEEEPDDLIHFIDIEE